MLENADRRSSEPYEELGQTRTYKPTKELVRRRDTTRVERRRLLRPCREFDESA
jgi:hypothetical protein